LQRAATADAELKYARCVAQAVAEQLKMLVVYRQIVMPLLRNPAVMSVEKLFELTGWLHDLTWLF